MRLIVILLVAVLGTAFYVIHYRYESRRLYSEIDKEHTRTRTLQTEYERLTVQKREAATSAKVQQVATTELDMRLANTANTQFHSVPVALFNQSIEKARLRGEARVESGRENPKDGRAMP